MKTNQVYWDIHFNRADEMHKEKSYVFSQQIAIIGLSTYNFCVSLGNRFLHIYIIPLVELYYYYILAYYFVESCDFIDAFTVRD
jgi:hypothetical protein